MTNATLELEHMCRELPEEILVFNVLPCLPMASLCRFRAVSKKQNALLTQSDFAAQHTLVSLAKEFVLINFLGGWNIVDVANSRVSPLSHDFLATSRCGRDQKRKILATDGGLVVVWYGSRQDHSLVVCNPILKTVKVIPLLQDRGDYDHNHTVMSTNKVSMEYKIVVFRPMEESYQANYMAVFESKIGRWRRVVHTSMCSPGWWYKESRLVKLKNALYQLYVSGDDMIPHLIKFDKKIGVGFKLDVVEVFMGNLVNTWNYIELVVSCGRLFCMYRSGLEDQRRSKHKYLEIFEIFPKRHECKSLVRMPRTLLHWLDYNNINPNLPLPSDVGLICHINNSLGHVVPVGCASSILFCSNVGQFVAYDLANKSWHQFSHDRPLQPHKLESWLYTYLYCNNFDLSLCPF